MSNLISRERRDQIIMRSCELLRRSKEILPPSKPQQRKADGVTVDLNAEVLKALRAGTPITFDKGS